MTYGIVLLIRERERGEGGERERGRSEQCLVNRAEGTDRFGHWAVKRGHVILGTVFHAHNTSSKLVSNFF